MSDRYIGEANFLVDGKCFKTSYIVYGKLRNTTKRPLVLLHGGPGMSHEYMVPHTLLYEENDRPLVFYDQIGLCQAPNAPSSFWTVRLFVDELLNLLRHLNIDKDFDLLGHSWGGVIAASLATQFSVPGLKHLLLVNTFADTPLYRAGIDTLHANLPNNAGAIIRKADKNSHEYKEATMVYYRRHLCTLDPWPPAFVKSLVKSTVNRHPDFSTHGILKDWSVVDDLHKITAMTLLVSSPNDQSQEIAYMPFLKGIRNIKWVHIQKGSHLPMWEAPEMYFGALKKFLDTERHGDLCL